jgi:2-polyprenyl-6-hydroxyphenyl methylase/3-demethylubiquinone-9 3-methyltransferase
MVGSVDFNKSCEDRRGMRLPIYGHAIYYRRCPACGFLFTDAFDDWTPEDFATHVYNADYVQVDPDYGQLRPVGNAAFVARLFEARKSRLNALDYGGGNGAFAKCLRAHGFKRCDAYDPFTPGYDTLPQETYNLVTCFETFEHTPDPVGCVRAIIDRLAEDGVVLFSTLVQPEPFDAQGLRWWYVGPRNGHISLHSAKSLALLWEQQGCSFSSVNENMHMACRAAASERLRLGAEAG